MEIKGQAEHATNLFALEHSLTLLVGTNNLTNNGFCNQNAQCCTVALPLSNKLMPCVLVNPYVKSVQRYGFFSPHRKAVWCDSFARF